MQFALILHAHLPYVRPSGPEILEERWFYEAVAETYIPLLWSLERLRADGVPARLAISFSPPLLAMLADAQLMERCQTHLARIAELAEVQASRRAGTPLAGAAAFHAERFRQVRDELARRGGDLLSGFRELEQAGLLELFTAAGTHGYLPFLATDAGRRAQIEAGLQEFQRHFGHRPAGIWLPECAYAPGLDHLISAAGVRWFITESSTLAAAWPQSEPLTCARTPAGVAAFARNKEAARQVWDSKAGYPGDPDYREFYRDEGYDLPLKEVAPWLVEGRVRSDTGLKNYRVTGPVELHAKEPYNPEWAAGKAREHARHYAWRLRESEGLVVTPFDAELFGHWWFEGPAWLEALFREIAAIGVEVQPVTPSDYLAAQPEPPLVRLPSGSWGVNGDHGFWLGPASDWLWPELHAAEFRMLELADPAAEDDRLNRAARQLLLAQASDWPFILSGGTTVEYATRRVREHLARFWALAGGRPVGLPDEPIFADLNARALFAPRPARAAEAAGAEAPLRILMLAWEFPPGNVGGLGRHVYDLGEALAAAGHSVQVIALADDQVGPGRVQTAGFSVLRVARPLEQGNFLTWVYRYNLEMVEAALDLAQQDGPFDVIHCHDWLVGQAGLALQARWHSPLVATMHATEKGRNNVIRDPIQEAIHFEEYQVTAAADAVITVSNAMAQEVAQSFRVAPRVIYNGVKLPNPGGPPPKGMAGPYFFYIGRLVVEKGVQTAIWALARLEEPVHLVVAGKGPMEAELERLAARLGVADRVHFVGRVTDAEKEAWLENAVAGLVPSHYEPFGITALEVMAQGTPVIVSDTGGLAEIVTGGADGLKVPPGHVEALAGAMASLLRDPEQARRLGLAGRTTVQRRFAWPAIAAETVAVYRSALCRRSQSPSPDLSRSV